MKFMKVAVTAVAFAAMAASTASATTGPAMVGTNGAAGTGSNTGAVSGNATSYAGHTFAVGGATVSCADANYTVTSTTTTSVTIDPVYAGCALLVSGTPVAAATVDAPCDWSLSFASAVFNNATGGGTGGSVTTNCTTSVTVPAVNCQIDVAAQTKSGISEQNIDASGANSTAATPWGSKIVASVTGLSYTVPAGKSCPGVSSPGTGTYAGTVATRNVFGTL